MNKVRPRYVRVAQAARILGMTRGALLDATDAGEVPCERSEYRADRWYSIDALRRILANEGQRDDNEK